MVRNAVPAYSLSRYPAAAKSGPAVVVRKTPGPSNRASVAAAGACPPIPARTAPPSSGMLVTFHVQ
jgi:hypothetical protein